MPDLMEFILAVLRTLRGCRCVLIYTVLDVARTCSAVYVIWKGTSAVEKRSAILYTNTYVLREADNNDITPRDLVQAPPGRCRAKQLPRPSSMIGLSFSHIPRNLSKA